MRPTIKDVAEKAGVGLSTVSRVISGGYPVSEEARHRVEAAIMELGYSPNAVARSLKSQKTMLIGVVVADISNPFYMQMIKGIEIVTEKQGYHIMISSSEEDPERERKTVGHFLDRQVDGIIVATCQTDGVALSRIKESGTPLVLVDRHVPGIRFDAVLEDNVSNAYDITLHLIESGHKRISVVNGKTDVSTAFERYQGFLLAHTDSGLSVDERLILDGSKGKAEEAVRQLLGTLEREEWPTAVFATNNSRCETIIKVFMEMNIKVPDDISIISYGNIHNPWMYSVKLTHVCQDVHRLGRKTAELLLEKLTIVDGSYTREYVINSSIVYGDSVKKLT